MVQQTIYTLKLEHGKYYVGKTKNIAQRLEAHKLGGGSDWTKIHKPLSVIETVTGDGFDEEKYTLIAMHKYGIENVRGGSYCTVYMSAADVAKIQHILHSVTDKCYKCGKSGHFSRYCTTRTISKSAVEDGYQQMLVATVEEPVIIEPPHQHVINIDKDADDDDREDDKAICDLILLIIGCFKSIGTACCDAFMD